MEENYVNNTVIYISSTLKKPLRWYMSVTWAANRLASELINMHSLLSNLCKVDSFPFL